MTSVSRRCSQQEENKEIIPVFRVVQGQLPHTLDLTWFEPLEGEQDKNIFGPKSHLCCMIQIPTKIFRIRKKVAFLLFQGWELKEPVQYKFKEFPYYETRKNEALFREYVKACEQVMEAIYI